MKILFVLRSVLYFMFYETVIETLCSKGHSVEVLFDRGWSESRSDEAVQDCLSRTPGLKVGWSIRRSDLWRRPLFALRELHSYASYLNRQGQSGYYLKRWEGYLSKPLKLTVKSEKVKAILTRETAQAKLRNFENFAPPDRAILRWLKSNRPDVLVASPVNLRYSEEVEYVKAAKALGIPTVVPVISWDNLTTKGLLHIIPDITLAWNEAHRNEASTIHRVPQNKIVIVGSPFFDKWFDLEPIDMGREAFCRKVGLDPNESFILYLGSSANIARDETWLVRELSNSLRQHSNPAIRGMNILVRPHPANAQVYRQLDEEKISVWPKEGALPDSEESLQDFYHSALYCVATVGVNTTGMIDAVILDKPGITLMTGQYESTQSQTVHFQYLLDADVLEIARSTAECADLIELIFRGKDSKREARRRYVEKFIRPRGLNRPAGQVAAQVIESAALGKSAEEINAEMDVEREFDLMPAKV